MTDRDDKATRALRAIVNLMGNVDHSKPGGPNDAAMRGGMLMDCKAIAENALASIEVVPENPVDQQRRDAEAEAQRNMTDATYEPEGESDVR